MVLPSSVGESVAANLTVSHTAPPAPRRRGAVLFYNPPGTIAV